jgi:hypothetical protein
MTKVAPTFNSLRQEASLAHSEAVSRQITGVTPVLPNDLLHELRQPLGVIDSLAYYLELTCADEKNFTHLRHIRAMVSQANRILERATASQDELALGPPFLSGA